MKKTLLLLVALITATIAFAYDAEIDGIYYNLDNSNQTAEVTSGGNYSGDITIPEKVTYNSTEYSVTSIGNDAFYGCSSLISITIPNSVTSIGNSAFWNCSSLTSITIPNSVTSIGAQALSVCSSLTSITIPNSVTSIGERAFHGTTWLNNQPDGCLYIGKCLYQYKGEMPENTHINVNEGTTMICASAFSNCSSLTSITIPNSVTSIGSSAFYRCSSLTSIEVDANNPNYTSIEGVLYNKDVTTLICCPGGKTSISIPNSVTSIGGSAFSSCSSLTSITIPNSVTSIRPAAFYDCSSLTSITIPNSVTSIGSSAFSYCSSLTSISIPNSVTSIGSYAFHDCSSLTSISIPNSVTSIGYYAFSSCSSLTSISIGNSVTSIRDGAFDGCSRLTSITCLGSTPPSANDLQAQYGTCILFVPKGSLNDYQNHAEWGKFLNIQELEGENPVDLETSKISSANIYTTNGTLHIEGATSDYHILDATGRLIYSGNATTLQLPRGIYLVTMGGEVEKIAL